MRQIMLSVIHGSGLIEGADGDHVPPTAATSSL